MYNYIVHSIIASIWYSKYTTHNNKWNFQVVRALLNLKARGDKSSVYYCEYDS